MHFREESAAADFVGMDEVRRGGIGIFRRAMAHDQQCAVGFRREGHARNLRAESEERRVKISDFRFLVSQLLPSVWVVPVMGKMLLWIDPTPRSGPEAMAVDEWLLENATLPVLRTYRWLGDWVSIGYFGTLAEARAHFPEVEIVRRWTGGGTVDHRCDWTYTLVVPRSESLANLRGGESYGQIHNALAETLRVEGIGVRASEETEETGVRLCFENPVQHDLVAANDRKIAGAGQRRTRHGLLHQGSVAAPCNGDIDFQKRSENFASRLAAGWENFAPLIDMEDIQGRVANRYAGSEWTDRR